MRNRNGPLSNVANALLALRNDPTLRNAFVYDEMLCVSVLRDPKRGLRPLTDADITATQEFLQWEGLATIGKDAVYQAVEKRVRECSFHPVRDWLTALRWDGKPRLASWLAVYLGAGRTITTSVSAPCF
jgi:predicted P-loop ATPase